MKKRAWFGKGLPKQKLRDLPGKFIVIEGQDGAGRTTHVSRLRAWFENKGFATAEIGLRRSELAGKELSEAMSTHSLTPLTMSLFYATDLADQVENVLIPSLRAGFVVLADRYIYSIIARAIVRGQSKEWISELFGFALKPDAAVFLKASPQTLASRSFFKGGTLSFWESGQDIEGGGDIYLRFIRYQTKLAKVFDEIIRDHEISIINAEGSEDKVQTALEDKVTNLLF